MKTYDEAYELLDAIETLAQLQAWSKALYESGLLDESEQTRTTGARGPISPWSFPESATEAATNGEDITIRLEGGELAQWVNSEREWLAVRDLAGYHVEKIRNRANQAAASYAPGTAHTAGTPEEYGEAEVKVWRDALLEIDATAGEDD